MLSVRKVLTMLALGVLAMGAASTEARSHLHRSAQAIQKANPSGVTARLVMEEEIQSQFTSFMKAHDREYSVDELFIRYNIFKDNYHMIVQHNAEAEAGLHTHTLGVGKFTDFTPEEFRTIYLTYQPSNSTSGDEWEMPEDWNAVNADQIDWRQKGRVLGVKDQGGCGSCWAFASVATMESAHAAKSGRLDSLSEQQLVDCAGQGGGNGCNGGNIEAAIKYVTGAGGIAGESAYAYTSGQSKKGGTCQKVKGGAKATMTGVTQLPHDESSMASAVSNIGVVAVGLDASSLQNYHSGVLSSGCGTKIDHAVAIVGYGTQSNQNTWTVRNSWGASWGMGGYFYIKRGVNMCGIAGDPSYATAAS